MVSGEASGALDRSTACRANDRVLSPAGRVISAWPAVAPTVCASLCQDVGRHRLDRSDRPARWIARTARAIRIATTIGTARSASTAGSAETDSTRTTTKAVAPPVNAATIARRVPVCGHASVRCGRWLVAPWVVGLVEVFIS